IVFLAVTTTSQILIRPIDTLSPVPEPASLRCIAHHQLPNSRLLFYALPTLFMLPLTHSVMLSHISELHTGIQ
nr:hypothetical protein [Deltaproteobacteria bacterium]